MNTEMFQASFWQSFLKLMMAVIMASAILVMPVTSSAHRDCLSSNSVSVGKHLTHGMVAAGGECCSASHCCPVLPESVAAVDVPAISRFIPSDAVQLDQPLLLVRSLHPPPRVFLV